MKKNNNTAIELISISKKYTIHHEKPTLMEKIVNKNHEVFYALNNIDIKINKGEKIGIIGSNGSGKTTLLKIIAGITAQTSGKINVFGKVVSLIDLEAGFHPDLTGEQNIVLNGVLLGMTRKEISQKSKAIIKFANIGKFIDAPIFTYSQGMKLRLGFSIAVHSEPDILILDENMSAGDEEFAKVSSDKIQQMFNMGITIIAASHNLEYIKDNCEKVLYIDRGKIKLYGPSNKVVSKYIKASSI